jgi:subtilisin family serine protease
MTLDGTLGRNDDSFLEAAALPALDLKSSPYGLGTDSPSSPGIGSALDLLSPEQNWAEMAPLDDQNAFDAISGLAAAAQDDFAANATTRGSLGIGSTLSGALETNGDRDWMRVTLTAGETYQFRMNRNSLGDPLLNLRNSGGSILATNDDGGGNLNALITYTATSSGDYFLDAGAYANRGTGTYMVSASKVVDDFAASTSTRGTLSVGASTTGTLETTRDHDWFRVNLTAGQSYEFRLDSGTLFNPYLYLRNSAGSLLSANDDSSTTNRNSLIRFTATASGTYYLDAGAYAEAYTGSYRLSAAASTPSSNYSNQDGYGEASVQRAMETLLGRSLASQANLNGVFWGLDRLGAPEVWAAGVTGQGVTVAVVDTGVDYNHIDLDANIWSNSREIAGNGVDDDGNGYVDDIRGWDFVDNDNTPMDLNNHGTHVAGIIAAENNGIGQTGVAYNARIMAVRVLDAQGSGSYTGVANGIRYAANNGAQVINLSLGGSAASTVLLEAIRYATGRGSVVVMAAGNDGGANPGYPGAYANEVGIAVGAIDANGNLAGFSNRAGATTKDYVTAAGVNVFSTLRGNQYGYMSGTSMATPQVAGAVALLRSYAPGLSASQIETLMATSASHGGGPTAFRTATAASGGLRLTSFAEDNSTRAVHGDLGGSISPPDDTTNNPLEPSLPIRGLIRVAPLTMTNLESREVTSPINVAADGLGSTDVLLTSFPTRGEAINATEAANLPLNDQRWCVDVLTGRALGGSDPWALPWLLGRG